MPDFKVRPEKVAELLERMDRLGVREEDLEAFRAATSAPASCESACEPADASVSPVTLPSAGPCVPWNSGLLMKLWSTLSRAVPDESWLDQ